MNRAIIQLSPDIFRQLHELCKSSTACAYRNARIILLASDDMPVIDIALALGVSARSVKSTIRRFNAKGLDALTSRGYAGRPSELTPDRRQAIIDLFMHDPSKFGISKAYWTAADVAVIACNEGIVEKIFPATVRRIVNDAGLDWHTVKRLCQGNKAASSIVVAEDECADCVQDDERMSMLDVWVSVCTRNMDEREKLTSIYNTLVRRYGSRDGGNHLQIELLSTHILNALKAEEAGNFEVVNKALGIVRSHIEELERDAASRKKNAGPSPKSTPAEMASDLLERWRRAQAE